MKPAENNDRCEQARLYYYDLLDGAGGTGVPPEVADHAARCGHCVRRVDRLRRLLARAADPAEAGRGEVAAELKRHLAHAGEGVTCRTAGPFLAALSDPAVELRIPTPITVHIENCPACSRDAEEIRGLGLDREQLRELSGLLKRPPRPAAMPECLRQVRGLEDAVRRMSGRPESGIVTTYSIEQPPAGGGQYGTLPVRVDIAAGPRPEAGTPPPNLRGLFKIGLAAAAIVLVALAFLLDSRTATGLDVGDVYRALEKVPNVHISRFSPDGGKLLSESWASRTLGVYIINTGSEMRLLDAVNGVSKRKQSPDSACAVAALSGPERQRVRRRIASTMLGLVPFGERADLPEGAAWRREETGAGKNVIYELTVPQENYSGTETTSGKWRVFLNGETNLPSRIEFFDRNPVENRYDPTSASMMEYPPDERVREVISRFDD
jgi:hypothetical protein